MLLGILVPKLVLTVYGSEVNGLLSSVTNIYAYIAIVEAGVAAASCQALYKPIAEKNTGDINAVLSATNRYYHRTGMVYLSLVLLFSLIYPALINTDIPYTTVCLIILFNGIGNVINYFFHGKYLILLKADGKHYVRTGLEMFTNILKHLAKIVLIGAGFDLLFVQFVTMCVSFVQMIYITAYIRKHYSWIDLSVTPNSKAISQSKNVFVHEVNYLITSNVDTVLLTVFTTLKTVSVYSLYHLLFSMIDRVLRIVRDSFEFKIAKIFNGDKKRFADTFSVFEVCYITLSFALVSIAGFFVLPFISLYTQGITDIQYVDRWISLAFVLIGLLSAARYPFDAMIHIAGHFRQTQKSAVIESVINLGLSAVLVRPFGIVGVLLGTAFSSIYRTSYLVVYVHRNILKSNGRNTCVYLGVNILIFLLLQTANSFIRVPLDSYARIFTFCVPYALGVIVLYFSVVFAANPKILKHIKGLLANGRSR